MEFTANIANLGKYNAGVLAAAWLSFPATTVCMTRLFSRRIWKHCSHTGRPWAFIPAVWNRLRAG